MLSALVGIFAWLCFSGIYPIGLSIAFLRWANPRLVRWPIHMLFVPCLLVGEWLFVWLIFYAAHDDGEGPPGLGLLLIPGTGVWMLTIVGYYVATAYQRFGGDHPSN